MLIGEYRHIIDDKKRLSLPAKFRAEVGKKIILTYGLDNCISLYTPTEWKNISGKLGEMGMLQADTRSFNRFILGGAIEVDVDSIGRILIPDHLKEYADLREKVVLIGVHNRIEIWDEEEWGVYKKKVAKQADSLAEKLGQVGAF